MKQNWEARGKGINIQSTQPDISTQDAPQDKNTMPNNEKLPTDCTVHPRKMLLTLIPSKKDLRKKSLVKQTERQNIKIGLNLMLNRFKGLEVMGTADQKSETNKSTKQKLLNDETWL